MWGTLIEVRQGQQTVGRVAVTDGMSAEAVGVLEDAGHEVVLRHYTPEELSAGVLSGFDAVVVRSATKMTGEVINASRAESGLSLIHI